MRIHHLKEQKMLKILLTAFGLSGWSSGTAFAQTKESRFTNPQPPRPVIRSFDRIFPGIEVPEHPERYVWKTTAKFKRKDDEDRKIPIIVLNNRFYNIGTIAPETEITLDLFQAISGVIYWSVPWDKIELSPDAKYPKDKEGNPTVHALLSGYYIYAEKAQAAKTTQQ
jgi:hypothetical protein